jgi:hypothetical protein
VCPNKRLFTSGQRKHARDLPVDLGVEKKCAMPERTLDNSLPASAVEKGGFAATGYEFIPAGEIG